MTASPPSQTGTRAHPHARRPWRGRRMLPAVILQALILLMPALGGRAQAETRLKGEVKVTTNGGFARLAFRFEKEVPATVNLNYPIVVVKFKTPVVIAVDPLSSGAADYISAARLDPDGTAIRIALKRQIKLNVTPLAEQLYVDLLPANWSGIMPGLPSDVVHELANRALEAERQLRLQRVNAKEKKTQEFRVKVATQPTFIRYVFAMPDLANVVPENADGKLTLDFDQAIKWDLADAKAGLPPTLKSIESDIADDFDDGHVCLQRRAAGAYVPRGPQHRGRCRSRQLQAQAGCRRGRQAVTSRRRGARRPRHRAARDRARERCRCGIGGRPGRGKPGQGRRIDTG